MGDVAYSSLLKGTLFLRKLPTKASTHSPPFSFPVILILFYFLTLFSKPFQQLTSSSEYLNYLVQVGQVKIATNQSQMFSGLFAHLDLG